MKRIVSSYFDVYIRPIDRRACGSAHHLAAVPDTALAFIPIDFVGNVIGFRPMIAMSAKGQVT